MLPAGFYGAFAGKPGAPFQHSWPNAVFCPFPPHFGKRSSFTFISLSKSSLSYYNETTVFACRLLLLRGLKLL